MGRAAAVVLSTLLACALLAGCRGEERETRATLEPAESPKLPRAEPEQVAEPAPAAEPEATAEPAPEPEAEPAPEEAAAEAVARPVEEPTGCRGRYERMRTQRLAHAALARRPLQAFLTPGGEALGRFQTKNVNGVPKVFGVLGRVLGPDCEPSWYRVQLPIKPNGIVGYVRVEDVELHPISTRILVELRARRVTVFDDGRKVLEVPAAVGSARTPTPTGFYYVNQRLRTRNVGGPFGPGAIGISAFTEVLTGWMQGGPIALHGTNRPDLIGQAVSNGCIRLHNDVVERLFDLVLPGTPVVVRP